MRRKESRLSRAVAVSVGSKDFEFGIRLAPKQSVTTWAKFSAPPRAAEKITVYLPGAPPFEDVEIGK